MSHRWTWTTILLSSVIALVGCGSSDQDSTDASNDPVLSQPHEAIPSRGITGPDASSGDGPDIDAPDVAQCPHGAEVEAVPGHEQFQHALDLGCEHSIYGEISFTEPIQSADGETRAWSIISAEHALTVAEMNEAGYIADEDYESHLQHVEDMINP